MCSYRNVVVFLPSARTQWIPPEQDGEPDETVVAVIALLCFVVLWRVLAKSHLEGIRHYLVMSPGTGIH